MINDLTDKNNFIGKDGRSTIKYFGMKNNYKGDKVGYSALHTWVRDNLPKPELCKDCNKRPPHDCANISQEYKRELSDWEWLCCLCHRTKDGRMNNLWRLRRGKSAWNKGKKWNEEMRNKLSNSHPRKIDENGVNEIKLKYSLGNITLKELAIQYKVSQSLIHVIVNNIKRIR